MVWAQMRKGTNERKEKKEKRVIMINWIKGHLKVLDSVGLAGEVSVCNLHSSHSLWKKVSDTIVTGIGFHSNVRQSKIPALVPKSLKYSSTRDPLRKVISFP